MGVLGIFGDETIRLLKEKWANASMLAEELFSIFTSQEPVNIPAGSTIQPPAVSTQPLLNIPGYTEGSPIFSFTGAGGDPIGTVGLDNGELTFTPPTTTGGGVVKKKTTPPSTNSYPGQIISGSGSIYLVNTFPNGLANAGIEQTVTQLQIDPSATIPASSWVIVVQMSDGSLAMQFPVWG